MRDIEDVVSYYGVEINSQNKACCPIHKESTPSFSINPEQNFWYCFGACGKGGDSIEFVKEIEDCDFKTALSKVCEILGVDEKKYMEEKEISTKTVEKEKPIPLDSEFVKNFIASKGYKSNNYRGIRDEINKFFGHLTELDSDDNVKASYYPETYGGKLVGYKCRNHPKDFSHGKIGITGSMNDLSGQVKFKSPSKYVLLVGGEHDKAASYQMLLDTSQEGFNGIPVVSPTSGENSAAKQCAAQYEWFDQYDIIMIGLDNDAAGIKAAEEVAKVLPKEKVRIVRWSGKDPNQMLVDGKQKQFVRDFYNAKEYVSSGILTSSNGMLDKVKEELLKPRITLPPHMHKLQAAMKGGIQQGRIVNIIADTSVGKSITVNDMVYHWIFNAPEPVGVCSLEATAGQYTLDMLSIHLEKNLQWMGSGEEVLEYLDRGDVKLLYEDLLYKEDGSARWCILDERDGDIKRLEKQCERMVSQYGCKIIVIDVLTDILRGTNADSQEDHMAWQKRMVKNGVTIINVLHSRKPPANADGKLRKVTEYDAFGSGTFIQSAAINIVLNRDKMSTDSIERNTTIVDMPKCRGGITGEICKWYYDPETRKVYDFDDWIGGNKPLQLETPLPELGEDGVFNNIPDYEEYQEMEN